MRTFKGRGQRRNRRNVRCAQHDGVCFTRVYFIWYRKLNEPVMPFTDEELRYINKARKVTP